MVAKDDLIRIMQCDTLSDETYAIMARTSRATRKAFSNGGQAHAKVGINYGPCSKRRRFCVFGTVTKKIEFTSEEAATKAKAFEAERSYSLR